MPTRKITKKRCYNSVQNDGMTLRLCPNRFKTIDLCELALNQAPLSMFYVPSEFKTMKFVKTWFNTLENWLAASREKDKNNLTGYELELSENNRLRRLREIMAEFTDDINNNREIISTQRKLGARIFVEKKYDKNSKSFITTEKIFNCEDLEERQFCEFDEFYEYVDGDLKYADLLEFNFNGVNLSTINISEAYVSSDVLYAQNIYDNSYYESITSSKEVVSSLAFANEDMVVMPIVHVDDIDAQKLNNSDRRCFYISDMHLMHKIKKQFPVRATKMEIVHYIKSIVSCLVSSAVDISFSDYLFIGGDISYNLDISRLFYSELASQFHGKILVVLGNHELWNVKFSKNNAELEYSPDDLNTTIEMYREMFEELGIVFLHNQLFAPKGGIASEEQLLNISEKRLKEIALENPFLVLGGLGFSGYCEKFNATHGLYRNKVGSLKDDLIETEKFEKLYVKLKNCMPNEKLIVFTHTPKDNWSKDKYNNNWIYISGHTHKNEYFANEDMTVYADNQIGYKRMSFVLKSFNLSGTYDVFKYYEDGVHVIDRFSYSDFNTGMSIQCNCNRSNGTIYMLKKSNNYCFFYEGKSKLYILDGGVIKNIQYQDLNYYFERLEIYAKRIKEMLYNYNYALKQIAREIKSLGGNGNVHGCIVDIDFYNHIFVNPIDGTITPYFALDIVNKKAYSSVKSLLEDKLTMLHDRYIKMSSEDSMLLPQKVANIGSAIELSRYVFDTSMYAPSRVIRSMQYLTEANVVRFWDNALLEAIENSINSTAIADKKEINTAVLP